MELTAIPMDVRVREEVFGCTVGMLEQLSPCLHSPSATKHDFELPTSFSPLLDGNYVTHLLSASTTGILARPTTHDFAGSRVSILDHHKYGPNLQLQTIIPLTELYLVLSLSLCRWLSQDGC